MGRLAQSDLALKVLERTYLERKIVSQIAKRGQKSDKSIPFDISWDSLFLISHACYDNDLQMYAILKKECFNF